MKTLLFAIFVALSGLSATPSHADPGSSCHFHGSKQAPETTVLRCANSRKEILIKSGKLDKSWDSAVHDSIALVDGKKGKEWTVIYKNLSEPDNTKRVLYMFFNQTGNFIAANFTGS